MIDRIHILQPTQEGTPLVDPNWYRKALFSRRCCGRGCGSVRPEHHGCAIDVPLSHIDDYDVEPAPMALIVHLDLFDLVRHHLAPHVVGRCIEAESKAVIATFVTVYTLPRHSPYYRSASSFGYRVCKWCGTPRVRRMEDQLYFTRNQLGQRDAWQIGNHGLLAVSSSLRDSIDWSRFPRIQLNEVLVHDRPLPGDRLNR